MGGSLYLGRDRTAVPLELTHSLRTCSDLRLVPQPGDRIGFESLRSVCEVAGGGEVEGHSQDLGGGDHLGVADRPAGLHHGADPGVK
jgi:hypothetical protein